MDNKALPDHFKPSEVVVTEMHEGATTFQHLDKEKLGHWLKRYTLGEAWQIKRGQEVIEKAQIVLVLIKSHKVGHIERPKLWFGEVDFTG